MREVKDAKELAELPELSVVQFWGEALGDARQLVWQKDDTYWYSAAGSGEGLSEAAVPQQMFPAHVLWVGEPLSKETQAEFDAYAGK
ncbi:hypothetical protein [Mycobacterium avium]|uniref:hypothetical protein n=1 Tax=Mycobacterium avium TaxID=1764 RepID=UPI0007A0BACA|nr:hypothetical protein [Mycobacterium avium]